MKGLDYFYHRVFVKPVLTFYLRRDRRATFDNFSIEVRRGVFHPLLYFSTKFMYGFIRGLPLRQKSFLDVGCGSGLLSLLAYRSGAKVTAIDIDPNAAANTRRNFEKNFGAENTAQVLVSDLFDKIGDQVFDLVVINPPYYFKDVAHPSQLAWYCGSDGNYFERLFAGLGKHTHAQSQVFMVLEENCEIGRIRSIGLTFGYTLELETSKQFKWEKSYIFRLKREAAH